MRSENEIRERLAAVEGDERLYYPCATVLENAPLALEQMGMETTSAALRWVLGEKPLQLAAERKRRHGRSHEHGD